MARRAREIGWGYFFFCPCSSNAADLFPAKYSSGTINKWDATYIFSLFLNVKLWFFHFFYFLKDGIKTASGVHLLMCRFCIPHRNQTDTARPWSNWCRVAREEVASHVWKGHPRGSRKSCRDKKKKTQGSTPLKAYTVNSTICVCLVFARQGAHVSNMFHIISYYTRWFTCEVNSAVISYEWIRSESNNKDNWNGWIWSDVNCNWLSDEL